MALAPVYKPLVRPSDLKPGTNGKLPPCSVTPVYFPGVGHSSVHANAARAWNVLVALVTAEANLGPRKLFFTVTPGGAYRSYDAQVSAFKTRMRSWYDPLTCTTTTRTWEGKKWWLKRGYAPVASPEWYDATTRQWFGGSNHGWGLAFDTALWDGKAFRGITSDAAAWNALLKYAPLCGFSWEGAKPGERGYEPWHIRFVGGDKVPQYVIDVENYLKAQEGK